MQEKCSLCGIEEELVDAIGPEEIMRVCRYCANNNKLPILKVADSESIKSAEMDVAKRSFMHSANVKKQQEEQKKASVDKELEKIVKDKIKEGDYKDLVDNFHWIIQHARRLKKISQKQMAEAIAEPEIVVAMAEKKQLPEDYIKVINKMEQFLGIILFKQRPQDSKGIEKGEFNIQKADLSKVNIADLRGLKRRNEIEEARRDFEERKRKELEARARAEEERIRKEKIEKEKKEIEAEVELGMQKDNIESEGEVKQKKKGFFERWFGLDDDDEDVDNPFKGVEKED